MAARTAAATKPNPMLTPVDIAPPVVLLEPGLLPVDVPDPEPVELPEGDPDEEEDDDGVLIGAVSAAAWKPEAV